MVFLVCYSLDRRVDHPGYTCILVIDFSGFSRFPFIHFLFFQLAPATLITISTFPFLWPVSLNFYGKFGLIESVSNSSTFHFGPGFVDPASK
jgi:hypothetical protein